MNKKLSTLIIGILLLTIVYASKNFRIEDELEKRVIEVKNKDEILLKSKQFIPDKGISEIVKNRIIASAPKKTHVLLQFDSIPTKEEKEELEKEGIRLLAYIPNKAWFASIPSDITEKVGELPDIIAITEILTEDKISPAIKNKNYIKNEDRTINLSIKFFNDVDLDDASSIIEEYGEVVDKFYSPNIVKVIIEEEFISDIANEESVQWINVIEKILEMHNDGNRENVGVNILQTSPYSLSGINVVTAEWDGGWVDTTHDDLQGRVIIADTGSSTGDHATHVAGTMLGNGTLSETEGGSALQWRGMAPKATVISYEWWDDSTELNDEYDDAINTYDASLSQNSWGYTYRGCGSDCFGGYDSFAAELDEIVRGSKGKKISQIWSAGNERPSDCDDTNYDCIGLPGTAKNVITVGATNSDDDSMTYFSSWGPTNDGRLKPEVTAPGCEGDKNDGTITGSVWSTVPTDTYDGYCGTSMSAPTTSGVIALMLEEFADKGIYPLPSTIKAILIHTARDLGNTGPDYSFGYGRINATAAIDKIKADVETNDVIKEEIISNGETKEFNMTVSSTIKVTLVWDDYPAAANADPTLVNDLDLVLIAPDSSLYYPWVLDPNNPGNAATTGTNTIDNVEQVFVASPESGIWTVRVNGTIASGPQNFSLVSEHSFTIQPSVTVKTFRDSYTTEDKFFDLDDVVYIQANVTAGGEALEGNTVTADLILSDGSVEDSLTLTEIGNGIYRNSWDSTSHTIDVYLVNVSVTGEVEGNGKSYFHLYLGSGISAYQLDWNDDKNKDYISENKHLISVYDGKTDTDKSLLYLYQKDTDLAYTFIGISDTDSIGRGEITTTNLKGLRFYSFLFSQTGESLSTVALNMTVEVSDPIEELITYYDTSNGASYDANYYVDNDQWIGERFDPADLDIPYTLTQVSVYVDKGNWASNPLIVEIRSDSGGLPSNTILTSESVPASSVPSSSAWVDVTFSNQITLEQGGLYWLVLRNIDSRGGGPNYVYTWTGDDTSPAYPGSMAFSQDQGSSWTDGSASYDMIFRAYGYPTAITTTFNLSIQMNSEDVDYLVHKLSNFDEYIDDINDSFSVISGTLGHSVDDDRYHLQTGEDDLITSLTANQWNNYNSNYTIIYDNSIVSDSINNNVIALIRFNETAGMKFDSGGLWYDNSYNTEGLRIRYNTSSATTSDEINYLLAFTKGDWQTINQWMQTIESGQYPSPNFMTSPPTEFISITLYGYPIDFGNLDPDTYNNPATGTYNISIDPETTVNVDLYQKGDDYVYDGYILGISNMSWYNESNIELAIPMKDIYENPTATNVMPNTNISSYYWISIPLGQKAGDYASTIYIKAVETGNLP